MEVRIDPRNGFEPNLHKAFSLLNNDNLHGWWVWFNHKYTTEIDIMRSCQLTYTPEHSLNTPTTHH